MVRRARGSVGWGGIAVLAVLLVGGGAAWWLAAGGEAPLSDRLAAGGPIRVGYANEEPFGYLDADSGAVTGEAPEIARHVLAQLGVTEVETVVARFGELIPALHAGQLDVVAAGMYVTPKRCREVLFSQPTYRIGEGFIVREGNPLDLHGYADVVAHASARLGVMGGAVQHGYAKTLGIPEERIAVFEDYPTALVALEAERVDAVAATSLTIGVLLRKRDDAAFESAQPFDEPVIDGKPVAGYGAFAFRREDTAFRDAFDQQLDAYLGTQEHLDLVAPFGFGEHTLPGDVTTASLCGGEHP